jgi:hypothetical protein
LAKRTGSQPFLTEEIKKSRILKTHNLVPNGEPLPVLGNCESLAKNDRLDFPAFFENHGLWAPKINRITLSSQRNEELPLSREPPKHVFSQEIPHF